MPDSRVQNNLVAQSCKCKTATVRKNAQAVKTNNFSFGGQINVADTHYKEAIDSGLNNAG